MDKGVEKLMVCTTTQKVDAAEGVSSTEKQEWFVAIVNNRSEKKYAHFLHNKGYKVFVPIQSEEHIWRNGTVKTLDRVLISTMIFIYCTECERKEVIKMPFINRFMVDYTQKDKDGKHPIAKIPEWQMDFFRELLEKSDEPITVGSLPLNVGDKVKVIRGRLAGIEGRILQQRCGEAFLIVEITLLGCAKLGVSLEDVEKIDS